MGPASASTTTTTSQFEAEIEQVVITLPATLGYICLFLVAIFVTLVVFTSLATVSLLGGMQGQLDAIQEHLRTAGSCKHSE